MGCLQSSARDGGDNALLRTYERVVIGSTAPSRATRLRHTLPLTAVPQIARLLERVAEIEYATSSLRSSRSYQLR